MSGNRRKARRREGSARTPARWPEPKYRVSLAPKVLQDICWWTTLGCARSHKQERLGFLFGHVDRNRYIRVTRATLYRGGKRTRTGAWIDTDRMESRRIVVGRKLSLRGLGTFHSHISSVGEPAHGVSAEDKGAFKDDICALINVIVAVRPADRKPARTSKRALIGYEKDIGCTYNIRAYAVTDSGVRMVPVRVAD
jgi:hypothetical protein